MKKRYDLLINVPFGLSNEDTWDYVWDRIRKVKEDAVPLDVDMQVQRGCSPGFSLPTFKVETIEVLVKWRL